MKVQEDRTDLLPEVEANDQTLTRNSRVSAACYYARMKKSDDGAALRKAFGAAPSHVHNRRNVRRLVAGKGDAIGGVEGSVDRPATMHE